MRAAWVSFVPKEWKDREEKGLCPVCGVHHDAFEPGMKKFCSPKCRKIYSDKLIFWAPEIKKNTTYKPAPVILKIDNEKEVQYKEKVT